MMLQHCLRKLVSRVVLPNVSLGLLRFEWSPAFEAGSSAKAQHHHSEVIAELEAASSNARHYARTCGDVTTVQQLPSVQMLGRLGAVADNLTLTSIGSDTVSFVFFHLLRLFNRC
jgi:hypothetical protein